MKTKLRSVFGLVLLLLVGAQLGPVASAAQSGPSSLIVSVSVGDYDVAENTYKVSVSVNSPQGIYRLIVSVEDAEGGMVVINPFEINLGGFQSRQFELAATPLQAEHKYLLKVQATKNASGELIERSGDIYGQSADERYTLASKEFVHQPPKPPEFGFTINAVSPPDYEADTVTIMLSVPGDYQVLRYDGFIIADTGQQVGVIPEELYRGPTLTVPLPASIAQATEEHQYKVTLRLYAEDNRQAENSYEVTFTPPPKPGFFKQIGDALTRSPWIAVAIVAVIAAAVSAYIFFGKKAPPSVPPLMPVHDNTQANRVAPRRGRLHVRVVESPGASRGREWTVKDFPCRIGREENCQIHIDDTHVSRQHLEITWRDGRFLMTDPNSTHGTFMNGVQLRKGVATRISGVVSVHLGDRTVLELDTGE